MKNQRQLAAIMFTDIEGYTALMQQDEKKALAMRERHRDVFSTSTNKYKGQILQYYGDGTLSIFNSVIEAVNCAVEMQKLFQKIHPVPVRIGIHLGDIIVTEDDIIGDAVNVASRIESMAMVGSVLVSDRVHRDIINHEEFLTQSLGIYTLKNVEKPIEVFAISNQGLIIPEMNKVSEKAIPFEPYIEHNLPNPESSFIGRKEEIEKIKDYLTKQRLVTLFGPGGCGKTRLAIEVAKHSLINYPDGIVFLDLAPLENTEFINNTFAQELKIKRERDKSLEESIAGNISHKKMLLVIENNEHLIDKCASLIRYLFVNTEQLKILVTSREVLNIKSELKYYVPPLGFPNCCIKLSEIDNYESILLFRDRAYMNNPNFVLDEDTISSVTSICQQLEGNPLAIELAASRINFMDPETILKRLQNQFALLQTSSRSVSAKHQSIKASLECCHELLTNDEKLLLYRLSIFSGDFNLDEVELICSNDPLNKEDIIELVSRLSEKSLVVIVEKEGGIRKYRLLELIKDFGKERLEGSESKRLKKNYSDYYLGKADPKKD